MCITLNAYFPLPNYLWAILRVATCRGVDLDCGCDFCVYKHHWLCPSGLLPAGRLLKQQGNRQGNIIPLQALINTQLFVQ